MQDAMSTTVTERSRSAGYAYAQQDLRLSGDDRTVFCL
jgi:hypothetical protein